MKPALDLLPSSLFLSVVIIVVTLPFSLFFCIKVRAVVSLTLTSFCSLHFFSLFLLTLAIDSVCV